MSICSAVSLWWDLLTSYCFILLIWWLCLLMSNKNVYVHLPSLDDRQIFLVIIVNGWIFFRQLCFINENMIIGTQLRQSIYCLKVGPFGCFDAWKFSSTFNTHNPNCLTLKYNYKSLIHVTLIQRGVRWMKYMSIEAADRCTKCDKSAVYRWNYLLGAFTWRLKRQQNIHTWQLIV